MKNNVTFYMVALLTMTIPNIQAMHEAEDLDASWADSNEHDSTREQREELQRSRALTGHDWVVSRPARQIGDSTNSTPADQPAPTRVKFAEKKWTQKVSDFFSNLFGKKAVVDDKFLTHNLKTSDSDTTNALTTDKDTKLFKSLSEDQQEESLNRWLTVERNKFTHRQVADREAYTKDMENLEKTRKKVQKIEEDLIDQSNDAGDEISKIFKEFKKSYPGTDRAILNEFTNVNNSLLAVRRKDNDLATNLSKQQLLEKTVQKLQAIYDEKESTLTKSIGQATEKTRKQLTKELEAIQSDSATLKKALETIQRNDFSIRQHQILLQQEREKVERDNMNRRIDSQNAFNRRLIHFRNEIQALLPADRELKYNATTGKFEYHTKTPGRQTEDSTVSSSDFRDTSDQIDIQLEPADTPRESESREPKGQPKLKPITIESSPEEIQQRIDIAKRYFEQLTSEEKTNALTQLFAEYAESDDDFKKEVTIRMLKSIEHDIPTNMLNEYYKIVSPSDIQAPSTEPTEFSSVPSSADDQSSIPTTLPSSPTKPQYHFGEEPTAARSPSYTDNIDDLLQKFIDEQ